ncbi:site-2 protease family protein [Sutterella sp.]|uniref:site-2 protease family protein n=1 Tax=Sutterella sp. TaxID=1981025 RepID=UPI0026DEA4D1|nr:site-2 protease family protein [Sutterella sp.]MDO5532051.1 site-2 protease family protein [Sutterella sp.]
MDSISHAIQLICVYAIPLIFAITLHESAHGWAAARLGDMTATRLGRVTINPIPHIDPIGTIAIPGALILMSALTGGGGLLFGWAKPVPINPWNFRNPVRGMMITALAGPLSNALQMLAWAFLLKLCVMFGIYESFVISVCSAGISVNLMLMAFNLIPIPPLDGGRIVRGLLPAKAGQAFDQLERYGMIILLVLMVGGGLTFFVRPFLMFGQWLVNLVL